MNQTKSFPARARGRAASNRRNVPDSWPRVPQQGNVNVRYFQPRGGRERGTGAASHLVCTRTSRTIDPSRSRSSKRHPLVEGGPVAPAQLVRWTIKRGFTERTRSGTHPVAPTCSPLPSVAPARSVEGGQGPHGQAPEKPTLSRRRGWVGRAWLIPCPTEDELPVGDPGVCHCAEVTEAGA